MGNITNYYIKNRNNLISNRESYITGNKFRISVLSPRLIRIEYNDKGLFEDRATSLVINRLFPKFNYSIIESETMIEVNTGIFTLTYVKDSPIKSNVLSSNIKAVLNGTDIEWQFNNPEAKNLRGINYSIDSIKDKIVLDKGLYSLDGFCVLDDSTSLVLDDNDTFIERDKNIKDIYLFMYGKDFDGCMDDYFKLTGYPSLIPRYALGAWWYKNENYNESNIEELISRFNHDNIPISILLLGDHWHNKNDGYTPSISMKNVSEYLNRNNIKLGVTVNPDFLITNNSNDYKLIGNYINNSIKFIPFSNEKIGLYFNVLINNLEANGVSLFSIDYNNPLDRMNLWKIDHYHYGKMVISGKRGLILSRNSGIASHRYPIIWSGKTLVNWRTFNLLPRYNLQGYNMGISFIAHPIGGYSGGIEEDELYLRYMQFACFSPIFLLASEGGKYYKREPWKWSPNIESSIIFYMNLRYKLIPYIYSESYNYHTTGKGIVKPFYFDYPKILDEPNYKNQYFFGREFFVSPITERKNISINRVIKKVFVPDGIWFDFLQGKKYVGGKYYNNFYRDEDYPVFVKAGSIIPTSDDIKENIPNSLELYIYPLDSGEYSLYEDDGSTYNFEHGMYMVTKFNYYYEENNYNFSIKRVDGRNLLSKRNYILRFKNIKNINEINISDTSIKYECLYDKDDFIVKLYDVMIGRDINVNIKGIDTIVSSVVLVNEEIKEILYDMSINTNLKEELDKILFSDIEIRKKRIQIRKLKRKGLENKYIKIFINLLEYIQKI